MKAAERKMSFNEFSAWAAEGVREYLPEEYDGAEVRLHKVSKLGRNYTALTVMPEGRHTAPTVDLNLLYRAYLDGAEGSRLLRLIADTVQIPHEELDFDWLFDYARVKDKLFLRVCNAKESSELLELVPHRTVADLAITYHVFADEHDGGFGSSMVTNEMLAAYGITEEQLYADARESSSRVMPAELRPLREAIAELAPEGGMPPERPDGSEMFILSNERRICGASALFYDGMTEMIAGEVGGSFFVIPSSVNELIILSDGGGADVEGLERTIREVNRACVEPSEFLSDRLYYYDARSGVFGFARCD